MIFIAQYGMRSEQIIVDNQQIQSQQAHFRLSKYCLGPQYVGRHAHSQRVGLKYLGGRHNLTGQTHPQVGKSLQNLGAGHLQSLSVSSLLMQSHLQVWSFQNPVDPQLKQADWSWSSEKVSTSWATGVPETLTVRLWLPQLIFTLNPSCLKPSAKFPLAIEIPSRKASKLENAKILSLAFPVHEAQKRLQKVTLELMVGGPVIHWTPGPAMLARGPVLQETAGNVREGIGLTTLVLVMEDCRMTTQAVSCRTARRAIRVRIIFIIIRRDSYL